MTEFIQWVNSKRVYHLDLESLDGSDFPVITKPVWTLTHQNADGSPSPCIGVLETPPDCHMGRDYGRARPGDHHGYGHRSDLADGRRYADFQNQRYGASTGAGAFADVQDLSTSEWPDASLRKQEMQKQLETEVARTASVVMEWRGAITGIERQFDIANLAVRNAKKHREAHALKAAMNDSAATAAIQDARSAQYEAEQRLADLEIALPEARLQCAAAEKAAESARHELAKFHGEKLMRERVKAAARMDAAFAEISEAFHDYQRLGLELQSYPDLDLAQGGMALSRWEDTAGLKRLASAVPLCLTKLPSWTWTHPSKRVPLAVAEAQFWNLPPEQPEKVKAA